jgi:uncharacterized protein
MSSVNASLPTSSLDAERRAHEPSMEEILASIRRIIADDDSLPVLREDEHENDSPEPLAVQARDEAPEPPVNAASEQKPEPESVRPREDRWPRAISTPQQAPAPARREEPHLENERRWGAAPSVRPIRSEYSAHEPFRNEPSFAPKRSSPLPPAPEAPRERPQSERAPAAPRNFPAPSPSSSPAPAQTLVSIDAAATVSAHFQALAESAVMQDSDFLNRCAQEVLRPMLKQWLDDNLPVLVERLVRAEIERVARGRR